MCPVYRATVSDVAQAEQCSACRQGPQRIRRVVGRPRCNAAVCPPKGQFSGASADQRGGSEGVNCSALALNCLDHITMTAPAPSLVAASTRHIRGRGCARPSVPYVDLVGTPGQDIGGGAPDPPRAA